MKHLTQAEYDEFTRSVSLTRTMFLMLAQDMAQEARKHGFVLTIEQHPTYPPAMGAHEDVVTVRRAR